MELNKNETIDCWRVICTTSEGRELSFAELRLEVSEDAARQIDEVIAEDYPVEWVE